MRTIHAVFQNDGKGFIARCLDVPVTTQGRTIAAAKKNLREAVELYLETWGEPEGAKHAQEIYLTSMEVGA
ncbi:MAG: type II toxin-antitoxin system HicB family antitoxin [Verrucomicrobia bacterium]|nr:type II toxin-antitoxin system HicB family antitoxin [Verrucomicrobiota bacterium]